MTDTIVLPPPAFAGSSDDCRAAGMPRCKEQKVDIVHVTGEGEQYYVLTQSQQAQLLKHVEAVEALMQKFHAILTNADDTVTCRVRQQQDTLDDCPCVTCQKRRWAREAAAADLLALRGVPTLAEIARRDSQRDPQERIAGLKKQRDEFNNLCSWWNTHAVRETTRARGIYQCMLSTRVVPAIDQEIATLQGQLKPAAKDSESVATGTMPSRELGADVKRQTEAGFDARRQKGVLEIVIFSRPNKRYYIPLRVKSLLQQGMLVQVETLKSGQPMGDGELKLKGKELLQRIAKKITRDIQDNSAKPLGNLEAKLVSWTAKEDSALNQLHLEVINWSSDQRDDAPYAAKGEAHLLRFAAQASAGFSGFDPKKGQVSLGVKGQASFALAEGKVTFESYLPKQAGYDCWFAYRGADGAMVYHRFGAFRLKGAVQLSCFVGAVASGAATAGATWKASPPGATALLDAPALGVDRPGGSVKLAGSVFAGAQAGGALTGNVEWMAPADQYRKDAGWQALLEIKAEGNVAAGVGAGLDFEIKLDLNQLYVHFNAKVVFGPGASGGFGTLVDFEKAGDLILTTYRGLSSIDYRYLLNINEDAFILFYQVTYKAMTLPGAAVESVLKGGIVTIRNWWNRRSERVASTAGLARRILNGEPLQFHGQRLSLNELPPEVMGPILYELTEGYVLNYQDEWDRAAIKLLRCMRSWRHFYLTLEHMHPMAQQVPAIDSLQRLSGHLTPRQLHEFILFIDQLGASTRQTAANELQPMVPWSHVSVNGKFEQIRMAQARWQPLGDDTRIV